MPPSSSTSSYQLPDLLSLARKIELRTNRHCRNVTLASERWFLEELQEKEVQEGNDESGLGLASLVFRFQRDPRRGLGPGEGTGSNKTQPPTDLTIPQMKIGLLAALCFPTCDLSQLRLAVDFWTVVWCENEWILKGAWGEDGPLDIVEVVRGWWSLSSKETEGESEEKTDVFTVLKTHTHLKHLLPQLTRLSSTMSPRWNEQFAQGVFGLRGAQIEAARYRMSVSTPKGDSISTSNPESLTIPSQGPNSTPLLQPTSKTVLEPTLLTDQTYIPIRRNLSGLPIIFCFIEALEGLELDDLYLDATADSSTTAATSDGTSAPAKGKAKASDDGQDAKDLERMKELVGDVIALAWDIYSYNIDQSLSSNPFNIVHVLLAQKQRLRLRPSPSQSRLKGTGTGLGAGLGGVNAAIHQAGIIVKEKFEEYERIERGLAGRCGLGADDSVSGSGSASLNGASTGSGLLKNWLWKPRPTSPLPLSSSLSGNSTTPSNSRYSNGTQTDLSLFLLGLKDCLVGSLNWAYETEMFFGNKGDSVRGYGWVFLLGRREGV